MVYFAKWKIILVLAVCALGLVYATPNLLPAQTVSSWQESLPGFLPTRQINLGLDLQGGAHLLLRVEHEEVMDRRVESLINGARNALRGTGIRRSGFLPGEAGFSVTLEDAADGERVRQLFSELDTDLVISIDDQRTVNVTYTEDRLTRDLSNIVDQSIEVIRRRIDEFGTNEPNIQRQGLDRILVQLPGVDDPERVENLIGQTARLVFRMVNQEVDPIQARRTGVVPPGSELLPDAEVDDAGEPVTWYVVRREEHVTGEMLTDAQTTFQDGRPVVRFAFDATGGRRFCDVTTENVNRFLAIVLDGQVISAPRINSPICAGSGVIEGGFTVETANDLALLLRAGALPAELSRLERRTVGPGLGADSIAAGETAAAIGFVAVIAFMVFSYGLFGVFATIALVFNLTLIVAGLSVLQATLTLPGIAGIVLTVGMAVDANVLIFERIREEIRNGRSPISAIDAGYGRALTTIIDSNITTLIAALLLYAMGSGPVRGFAVTLSIGILSSMFTAIMVTRLMVVTWLRRTRPAAIPI